MPYLPVDPSAVVDYVENWSDFLNETSQDDYIVSSSWAIEPQEGSPAQPQIDSDTIGSPADETQVFISGCIAGRVYKLRNTITTNEGRTDTRTIVLRCDRR